MLVASTCARGSVTKYNIFMRPRKPHPRRSVDGSIPEDNNVLKYKL